MRVGNAVTVGVRRLRAWQVIGALLVAALAVRAEEPGWVSLGLEGGDVIAVAFAPTSPDLVWAIAYGGLFRSQDGGASWQWLALPSPPGEERFLDRVLPSPVRATRTWVTDSNRLWRTDDGGFTWRLLPPAFGGYLQGLWADPRAVDRLYARHAGQLLRSEDGGVRWISTGARLDTATVTPDGMVWALRGSVLERSTDRGSSWRPRFRFPASDFVFTQLLIEARAPRTLWAIRGLELWRSEDRGRSFARVEAPEPAWWLADLVAPADHPTLLYLRTSHGIYRSLDRGSSWLSPSRRGMWGEVQAFAVRPGRAGELLMGSSVCTAGGLFASNDRGRTWTPSFRGLSARRILGLAVDSAEPARLIALGSSASCDGFLRSEDGGQSWELRPRAPDLVVADPFVAGRVHLVDFEIVSNVESLALLSRSEDFAVTRQPVGSIELADDCGTYPASFLSADPYVPGRLWAGGWDAGLLVSDDSGEHFAPWIGGCGALGVRGWREVSTVQGDPDRVLSVGAILGWDGGLTVTLRAFETRDAGATWTPRDRGLPGRLLSVTYHPLDPQRTLATTELADGRTALFAGAIDGAWQLVDATVDWRRLFALPQLVVAETFDRGTGTLRLRFTADGESWEALPPLQSTSVYPPLSLVAGAGTGGAGMLYVATSNGAWRYDLGGVGRAASDQASLEVVTGGDDESR